MGSAGRVQAAAQPIARELAFSLPACQRFPRVFQTPAPAPPLQKFVQPRGQTGLRGGGARSQTCACTHMAPCRAQGSGRGAAGGCCSGCVRSGLPTRRAVCLFARATHVVPNAVNDVCKPWRWGAQAGMRALRKRSGSASRRRCVPRPGHLHAPARPQRDPIASQLSSDAVQGAVFGQALAYSSAAARRSSTRAPVSGRAPRPIPTSWDRPVELLWIRRERKSGVGSGPVPRNCRGGRTSKPASQSYAKRFSIRRVHSPRAHPCTHHPGTTRRRAPRRQRTGAPPVLVR
jgi:hypothetical protein